jgi:hypothetical protein
MVIFSVTSSPFPFDGTYYIMWSTSSKFEEDKTSIAATGTLTRAYSVAVRFTVPEAKNGMYFVQFNLAGDEPLTLPFIVKEGIVVNPPAARVGDAVTVSGTGFPANDTGYVAIDAGLSSVAITTSDKGSFTLSYTIPNVSAGNHIIKASSNRLSDAYATAALEVYTKTGNTPPTPTPPPSNPAPQPPSAPANQNTNIAVSPPVTGKVAPPQKPSLIAPKNDSFGWFGAQSVSFRWQSQSASGSTSYKLEIAENRSFTPAKAVKSGITGTSYIINLQPGTYYWRIKAVDASGSESEWNTSADAFSVGSFPGLPLIIVGLILVIVLIVWMKSRNKKQQQEYYYY